MDNKDCGALWARSKDGKDYFTGVFTTPDGVTHEIVVFKNSYKKEGDKTPDWRIYPSKPRTEAKEYVGGYASPDASVNPDDIPF
jgi:hypothetical protein